MVADGVRRWSTPAWYRVVYRVGLVWSVVFTIGLMSMPMKGNVLAHVAFKLPVLAVALLILRLQFPVMTDVEVQPDGGVVFASPWRKPLIIGAGQVRRIRRQRGGMGNPWMPFVVETDAGRLKIAREIRGGYELFTALRELNPALVIDDL